MSDLKFSLMDSKIKNTKSTTGDVKENNWDRKRDPRGRNGDEALGTKEGGRRP